MPDPTTPDAPWPPRQRSPFLDGLADIAPMLIATVPFGLIFGALSVKEGLSLGEGVLMSALVYAGASQFVALELWADPLPFWSILLSVIAVNLRHVLYSASMGRRVGHWSGPQRWCGFALLVDATFALAELRGGERLSAGYYFGIAVPLYLLWVVTTAVGALFGGLVRNPEAIGLDFVIPAYFIFLVVSFRKRPNAVPVILASAAGSVIAYLSAGPPWHYAGGAFAGIAIAAAIANPASARA